LRQLRRGEEVFWAVPNAETLIILCHGYTADPSSLESIARLAHDLIPGSNILIPDFRVKNPFCATNPEKLVQDLNKRIELAWTENGGYQRVILVGHSFGALVARKTYAQASLDQVVWAGRVDRIVLLAAMNRGWEFSHHLAIPTFVAWKIGVLVARFQEYLGRQPLIFSVRRGGSFITGLQLLWLRLEQELALRGETTAMTIQLLGSVDDVVAPDDNLDLVTGGNFIYLDVPHSSHASIVETDDPIYGASRRDAFAEALTANGRALHSRSVHPSDSMRPPPRYDVTDVVFVIHGIRDMGYWTHKVARMIQREGAVTSRLFATVTASYGYFPLLPFLLPSRRRQKVLWLVDQFVAAKAAYPKAEFSFVGHSHGTYLLAKALRDYPEVAFKHVVFAGSVVPCQYPWVDQLRRGRVTNILNYVATADWVVAFFPKVFQILRLQDLGAGGHDGFSCSDPALHQLTYLRGQHGAALVEDNWEAIARFVVHGTTEIGTGCEIEPRRNRLVETLGRVPYLVWAFLVTAVGFGGWTLLSLDVGSTSLMRLAYSYPWMPLQVLAFAIYLWVIKIILTRL
jgi:pimeloyl-ACP methyl ester carboxylesterase